MKTQEMWRWWITDPASGRRAKTRHVMTEKDALELDAGAERVPLSLERRLVPEGPHEHEGTQPGQPGSQ